MKSAERQRAIRRMFHDVYSRKATDARASRSGLFDRLSQSEITPAEPGQQPKADGQVHQRQ